MTQKYVRMIKALAAKKKKTTLKGSPWFVYVLRCGDQSLYTGITNDVMRRLKMHQKGQGARYTRTRGPVFLMYQKRIGNRSNALVAEFELKRLPRAKKEQLIQKYQYKLKGKDV